MTARNDQGDGSVRRLKKREADMDKISVIIPCYNEQEAIPIFYDAIVKTAQDLSQAEMEFLFVNDGSKDESLKEMKALADRDERVKYVSFSRNF